MNTAEIQIGDVEANPLTGEPIITNIKQGYQDENGNIQYYESDTVKNDLNFITDAFVGSTIIAICVTILILYLKWLFIRSAVESGTKRAIESILENWEVIPPTEPDKPIKYDNEKQLRL